MENKAIRIDQEVIDLYSDTEEKLYKLTDRQAALLLGQTDYIAWEKRWINLTLSSEQIFQLKSDIDYRLMNPEECAMTIDYDAMCKAVKCGVVEAVEELSARILEAHDSDNIKGSITVDKDTGAIKVDVIGSTKPTVEGTQNEVNYGGVYNQALQIKKLFEDLNDYIDVPYGVSTIQGITADFVGIDPIADIDLYAAWQTAIATYVSADPEFLVDSDDLALQIWCNGLNGGLTNYAIAVATFNEANLNMWRDIVFKIPKTTYGDWFDEGQLLPNQGYEDAPCYTYPQSTLDMPYDEYAVSYHDFIFTGMSNRKVRLKIEVIEPFVDADGDKWDGLYYDPIASAPVSTYKIAMHNGSSFKQIDSSLPPYLNGSGSYFVEYNCNSSITGIRVPPELTSAVSFTPISGELRFTVFDLGSL